MEGEDIQVHVIALADLMRWLREREREGCLIDPKIYAGVQLIHNLGSSARDAG